MSLRWSPTLRSRTADRPNPSPSVPERVPHESGYTVDGVDAVLLRHVSVREHGDQVVTTGTADSAGGIDLPPVDDSEPVLERHSDPWGYTTRRPPVLGGSDVLHEVEDVGPRRIRKQRVG